MSYFYGTEIGMPRTILFFTDPTRAMSILMARKVAFHEQRRILMARNWYGGRKFHKEDILTKRRYSESDIRWEKFKMVIWIVLFILYVYFIIQPQQHF